MKKILLSAFTVLVIAMAAGAQTVHLGIKGGLNMDKIQGQSFRDGYYAGLQLGGFVDIGLSKTIGIQPEVLFNQVSTTVDSNYKHIYQNVFNSNQSDVKLGYLSIPILLNYKLLGNFLSLQAGPQFGVLLKQDRTLLQNGGDAFKKGDFSFLAGAQLKFSAIRVSARYAIGLKNINDIDNQDQWKSQGFQVSLGLAL